jgi:hypothetical protein
MVLLTYNKNKYRKCLIFFFVFLFLFINLSLRSEGLAMLMYIYLLMMIVIIIGYLNWIKSLQFSFKDGLVTIMRKKEIIFEGEEHEVITDATKWVYVFPNNIIVFGGFLSCIYEHNILQKFFNSGFNFSILDNKVIFYKLMKQSSIFRWSIISIFVVLGINLAVAILAV